MAKIQVDLSDEEDGIVEAYKLTKKLKTKQQVIKEMIKQFGQYKKNWTSAGAPSTPAQKN